MSRHDQAAAIPAALILAIGMGFGRFAFTGLYPLMVSDNMITVEGGSYAASANYAGYLIGALLAASLTGISSRKLCRMSALATVATLALLWLALPQWLLVTIRGLAGVASAIAMVAASQWLIHDRHQHAAAPTLFAGIGVGIFISAELIAAAHAATLGSASIWLLLALVSLVLSIVAIVLQKRTDRTAPEKPATHDHAGIGLSPLGPARLILVYGLAGFGYIVTATYLPLLVKGAFSTVDPVHVWALFGLGAAPSCFLWHRLHQRWGTNISLMANLIVQAIGVLLPVVHMPTAYILSAILVGGTFVGTVTIAMPAARSLASKVRFNMLAIMTAAYGVGQIAGPLAASFLFARTHSFDASLYCAGATLFAAALLSVPYRRAVRLARPSA